jgi:uncharacterized membrane protein YgcG
MRDLTAATAARIDVEPRGQPPHGVARGARLVVVSGTAAAVAAAHARIITLLEAEAQAAIQGLNGQQVGGRGLVVNEARPMEPRSGGFGGGGGGRGGDRGGYGGGGDRGGYGGGGGRGGY